MNLTHRKILFSIYFKPFIHFLGNKYLLEKEKEKVTHFFTVPSARPRNRPDPAPLTRALCLPGRNLGLGRQSRLPACSCLGWTPFRSTLVVHLDSTARHRLRDIKNPCRPLFQTLASFSSILSLSAPLFSAQRAATE